MSDVLRLVAGGLLALISCYLGILAKKHYQNREKFYATALAFSRHAIQSLEQKKSTVPEIVGSFLLGRADAKSDEFCVYLNTMLALKQSENTMQTVLNSENVNGSDVQSKNKMLSTVQGLATSTSHGKTGCLNQNEMRLIDDFFAEFGKHNYLSEMGRLKAFEVDIETRHKSAVEQSKKIGSMYFKLFVLIGLALLVILA